MKLLVGVTGSVAAIKLPDIVKRLEFQAGTGTLEIAVICTSKAEHFIDKKCAALRSIKFYTDANEWSQWSKIGDKVLHIWLRQWADAMVIAPLDANTLAKISVGMCDNLLTCVARAWDFSKPIWMCPAMNTYMWEHPSTAPAIACLEKWGYIQIPPVKKVLACGDDGMGAMAEFSTICDTVLNRFGLPKKPTTLVGKSITSTPKAPAQSQAVSKFINSAKSLSTVSTTDDDEDLPALETEVEETDARSRIAEVSAARSPPKPPSQTPRAPGLRSPATPGGKPPLPPGKKPALPAKKPSLVPKPRSGSISLKSPNGGHNITEVKKLVQPITPTISTNTPKVHRVVTPKAFLDNESAPSKNSSTVPPRAMIGKIPTLRRSDAPTPPKPANGAGIPAPRVTTKAPPPPKLKSDVLQPSKAPPAIARAAPPPRVAPALESNKDIPSPRTPRPSAPVETPPPPPKSPSQPLPTKRTQPPAVSPTSAHPVVEPSVPVTAPSADNARTSAFIDLVRKKYGAVKDLTTDQVLEMCAEEDPPLSRPSWFLDSDEWKISPFGSGFLYKVPKDSEEEASLAEMLAQLGPKIDVECSAEATAERLGEISFDFSFG